MFTLFAYVCHNVDNAETNNDINENINLFYTALDNVCTPLFKLLFKENNNSTDSVEKRQTFFAKECNKMKQMYYRCLKRTYLLSTR